VFRGNLGMRTPLLSVDAAVFDESGRLVLIQRADNGAWAMPGGAAEVGETPAEAVAREVREETGLEVRAVQLLGIYDSRLAGRDPPLPGGVSVRCHRGAARPHLGGAGLRIRQ
jgi:ADP-ribose pyrophosphatase YjhB (NUDIX family)